LICRIEILKNKIIEVKQLYSITSAQNCFGGHVTGQVDALPLDYTSLNKEGIDSISNHKTGENSIPVFKNIELLHFE